LSPTKLAPVKVCERVRSANASQHVLTAGVDEAEEVEVDRCGPSRGRQEGRRSCNKCGSAIVSQLRQP
jgi:hypothetical protein